MDFSIVTKAGLRPVDLAVILGMYDPATKKGNRATAANWMRGSYEPAHYSKYHAPVTTLLATLQQLVADGKLPRSEDDRPKVVAKLKRFINTAR